MHCPLLTFHHSLLPLPATTTPRETRRVTFFRTTNNRAGNLLVGIFNGGDSDMCGAARRSKIPALLMIHSRKLSALANPS